jgi:hypothetical protein
MDVKERTFRMTQPDMILVSMYRVSNGTINRIPYEDLVLQAWRDFPTAFSLRNHPEHPDASDVHKKLYGTLKTSGSIVALGNKVFRLTDKGLERARALANALKATPASQVEDNTRLARDQRNFLDHAIRSRAYETWRNGQKNRLVDYDARVFFQFSIGTTPKDRRRKVDFAKEAIEKAHSVGVPEAGEIGSLADFLIEQFEGLLKEGNS